MVGYLDVQVIQISKSGPISIATDKEQRSLFSTIQDFINKGYEAVPQVVSSARTSSVPLYGHSLYRFNAVVTGKNRLHSSDNH
jgi:hypothetical protein